MERKYSVLMSVYYKEKPEWLNFSIESMFNQTVLPDEFVLIEDGPLTKELNEVVESWTKKYPSVFKVIKLEKNDKNTSFLDKIRIFFKIKKGNLSS